MKVNQLPSRLIVFLTELLASDKLWGLGKGGIEEQLHRNQGMMSNIPRILIPQIYTPPVPIVKRLMEFQEWKCGELYHSPNLVNGNGYMVYGICQTVFSDVLRIFT